jgi:hypothetical protein
MKQGRWQFVLAISLVASATVLYILQIRIFHAERDTFFYLFQDLAFVPVQVLLVTLIVDRFLRVRERVALLKKLNMVIGAFFSEVGTGLLKYFLVFDVDAGQLSGRLLVARTWTDRQFTDTIRDLGEVQVRVDCSRGDLAGLKDHLSERRGFLLGLLENQNLLEHETFTELLWAVFHLTEELDLRKDVRNLSRADSEHIAGDIKRAYLILVTEWLSYMRHLQKDYPYLFSLSVRTNPFDPNAAVEVD